MVIYQNPAFGREAAFPDVAETIQKKSYLYNECFGMAPKEVAETAFLRVWCTDDSLHQEIEKIEKQIRFIEMKQGSYVFGFHSLERCVQDADPRRCVVSSVSELRDRAHKSAERTKTAYADKGDSERSRQLMDELVGEYRHPFENTRMGGETYQSEHVVLFQRVNDLAAYLSVKFEFPNGHQCKLDGVFEFKSNEDWLLHDSDESNICFLSAAVEGDRFMFSDPEGTCLKHCSAKADFNGVTINRRHRRSIADLDRVLNSRGYKAKVRTYLSRSKRD
ncbi:MAG: hypothetical protein VW684_10935 [Betaproteobacteria bacterium]|jgi:hypothetical protein